MPKRSPKAPKVTAAMLKVRREPFPELARMLKHPRRAARTAAVRKILPLWRRHLEQISPMPISTYTTYREFARSGSRVEDGVRRSRRVNLTTAVLCQLFDPRESTLDSVHDYLWSACEESTWIASAHEAIGMDLFETQSAFTLAECLRVLGRQVAPEVRERVEYEIRRRVIDPFLERVGRPVRPWPDQESLSLTRHFIDPGRTRIGFKRIMNNWIGVCYGAVGAVLIYMEENQARLGRGLSGVVKGLYEFLDVAFLDDGASTEGTGYWQFGLSNFVAFSELLRNRTGGRIDLLAHPKMRAVAEFPLKTRLSPGRHYSHADCSPRVSLMPGMASKLAERTGVKELLGLIPADTPQSWNMSMALRDLLWWNGRKGPEPRVTDSLLECAGMFRLVSGPVVIAGKAGHNAEHHNHNDVGSFVVHSRGEDLLCDPGAPRYDKWYFRDRRYVDYVQAMSLGHSVPAVGGEHQGAGPRFRGTVTSFDASGTAKSAEMEFARAYPARSLKSLRRRLELRRGGGFVVEDTFDFKGGGRPVEEGFVTFLPVTVRGRTARIRGERSELSLRVVAPAGARLGLEKHATSGHGRAADGTLNRIVARLPAARSTVFRAECEVRRR